MYKYTRTSGRPRYDVEMKGKVSLSAATPEEKAWKYEIAKQDAFLFAQIIFGCNFSSVGAFLYFLPVKVEANVELWYTQKWYII